MKKIFFLSFLLFPCMFVHAQNTVPNPTRITYEVEDFQSGDLVNSNQTYQYLDANGNVEASREDHWNMSTNTWDRSTRTVFILNTSGKPTSAISENIDPLGDWNLSGRNTYTYDANLSILSLLSESWDAVTGGWMPQGLNAFTYYPSGKIQSFKIQNSVQGVLKDNLGVDYFYDSAARLDSIVVHSVFNNTQTYQYQSSTKYLYTGGNSASSSELNYNWDATANNWILGTRISYTTIPTGNGTQRIGLSESWTGSGWETFLRRTQDFDLKDNLTRTMTELWTGQAYKPNFLNETSYNADNSINVNSFSDFDDSINNWDYISRQTYDYSTFVATHAPVEPRIQVFPNPVIDRVQVLFEDGDSDLTSLVSLMDAQGKMVKQMQFFGLILDLPMTELPAGTYFLRVERGGAVVVKTVMKP